MNFSLIMIGAHDGSKTESFIRERAALGSVLLVEPVPFLFEKAVAALCRRCQHHLPQRGSLERQRRGRLLHAGAGCERRRVVLATLGSLIAGHAESHDAAFGKKIRKVKCKSGHC